LYIDHPPNLDDTYSFFQNTVLKYDGTTVHPWKDKGVGAYNQDTGVTQWQDTNVPGFALLLCKELLVVADNYGTLGGFGGSRSVFGH
jgi:hypothetical protein